MTRETGLAIAFFAVGLGLPLLLLIAGFACPSWQKARVRSSSDWRRTLQSSLLCTIAFNLTFFIQEVFLVLPKAFVPGAAPTLYHNDHRWEGDAPILALFQGTGAVAILLSGLLFKLLFDRLAPRSDAVRLFALWMAFQGLFQSLPQFALGAITSSNDVGQAYDYLRLGPAEETLIALFALATLPLAGLWVGRSFMSVADRGQNLASWRSRTRLLWQLVSFPALAAVPLIVLFRVPREPIEVVALPLLVALLGAGWVHASAFHPGELWASGGGTRGSIVKPMAAAVLLFLFFQLVLRPGIRF